MGGYSRGGQTKRRRGSWREQRGDFGAGLYGRLETIQLLQSRGWRHEEIVNEGANTVAHVSWFLTPGLKYFCDVITQAVVGKFIWMRFGVLAVVDNCTLFRMEPNGLNVKVSASPSHSLVFYVCFSL